LFLTSQEIPSHALRANAATRFFLLLSPSFSFFLLLSHSHGLRTQSVRKRITYIQETCAALKPAWWLGLNYERVHVSGVR